MAPADSFGNVEIRRDLPPMLRADLTIAIDGHRREFQAAGADVRCRDLCDSTVAQIQSGCCSSRRPNAIGLGDVADAHLQALAGLVFAGGDDQRLNRRVTTALAQRQEKSVEAAPADRRHLAVDRVVCLAAFGARQLDTDQVVGDDLQADFGALRGQAFHAADDAQRPQRLSCGADRGQRTERDGVDRRHRRNQPVAGLRYVAHIPGAPWRRIGGESSARDFHGTRASLRMRPKVAISIDVTEAADGRAVIGQRPVLLVAQES